MWRLLSLPAPSCHGYSYNKIIYQKYPKNFIAQIAENHGIDAAYRVAVCDVHLAVLISKSMHGLISCLGDRKSSDRRLADMMVSYDESLSSQTSTNNRKQTTDQLSILPILGQETKDLRLTMPILVADNAADKLQTRPYIRMKVLTLRWTGSALFTPPPATADTHY